MSTNTTFNGTTYIIPTTGETDWGTQVTNFLVDVGNNANIKKEQIQAARTVAGSVTVAVNDYGIFVNQTAPATITLPSASVGQIFVIKDVSNAASINNITITPPMGMTIDGMSTKIISTNAGGAILQFAGSNTYRTVNESFGTSDAVSDLTVSGQATVGYIRYSNIQSLSATGNALATTAILRLVGLTDAATITLPATYTVGSTMTIKDVDGGLFNYQVTLAVPGGHTIDGLSSYLLTQPRTAVTICYTAANEWSIV